MVPEVSRLLHHSVWGVRFPLDAHDLKALPDRPEIDPNPTIPHRVFVPYRVNLGQQEEVAARCDLGNGLTGTFYTSGNER